MNLCQKSQVSPQSRVLPQSSSEMASVNFKHDFKSATWHYMLKGSLKHGPLPHPLIGILNSEVVRTLHPETWRSCVVNPLSGSQNCCFANFAVANSGFDELYNLRNMARLEKWSERLSIHATTTRKTGRIEEIARISFPTSVFCWFSTHLCVR